MSASPVISPEEAKAMFDEADLNHDGVIDQDEFCAAIKNARKLARKRRAESIDELHKKAKKSKGPTPDIDAKLDSKEARNYVEDLFNTSIKKCMEKYVRIPNQSPMFDKNIMTNGLQEEAAELLVNWVLMQQLPGLTLKLFEEENKTPLIYIEIESNVGTDETVLMYGHMDKQPPMTENWDEGLDPCTPVTRGDKLYGRGLADDGYSVFAAVTAVAVLQKQGVAHPRICIVIEGCEESGSKDLPYYIDKLADDITTPSLVICLDSGCGNYDQMWLTTSLRGMLAAKLTVEVLETGIHSGTGSGVVSSSFRIMRQLLDRVEDAKTGQLLDSAYVEIPEQHLKYAKETADTLGDLFYKPYKFAGNTKPVTDDLSELILNRCWRPTLSYTGVNGIPDCSVAGNVLRTHTSLTLSMRLPPSLEPQQLEHDMTELLTKDIPYDANVTFDVQKGAQGWVAPPLKPWLYDAVNNASNEFWGGDVRLWGEGGSIPFMGMLGRKFPETQFVITGLLGPGSNAHGPNEFMHIPTFKKLCCGMALVLSQHFQNEGRDKK